jgi:uncharacterized protein YceK
LLQQTTEQSLVTNISSIHQRRLTLESDNVSRSGHMPEKNEIRLKSHTFLSCALTSIPVCSSRRRHTASRPSSAAKWSAITPYIRTMTVQRLRQTAWEVRVTVHTLLSLAFTSISGCSSNRRQTAALPFKAAKWSDVRSYMKIVADKYMRKEMNKAVPAAARIGTRAPRAHNNPYVSSELTLLSLAVKSIPGCSSRRRHKASLPHEAAIRSEVWPYVKIVWRWCKANGGKWHFSRR